MAQNDHTPIFSVVWFCADSIEPNADCSIIKAQNELRSNFDKNLKIFEDDFECECHIRDQPLHTKILFVIDEVSAPAMVKRASYISQIVCTFVYVKQASDDQSWKGQDPSQMVIKFFLLKYLNCIINFTDVFL